MKKNGRSCIWRGLAVAWVDYVVPAGVKHEQQSLVHPSNNRLKVTSSVNPSITLQHRRRLPILHRSETFAGMAQCDNILTYAPFVLRLSAGPVETLTAPSAWSDTEIVQ